MKYLLEAITVYCTFFAIAGFVFLFIPFGFCFIVWEWQFATIQNVMQLLRLDAIVSAILLFFFYISQLKEK
jgi:glycopeptide antibiotics resistance protein